MRRIKYATCAALLVCIVVGTTGCGPNPLFDLINAGLKITNGQISQLTAAEVKTLNEVAVGVISEATGVTVDPLTDDQAAAIVTFFAANDVNTADDIEQLAQQAADDPSQIEGLAELAAAFADTDVDIDPADPDPDELEELFDSIFTGTGGAPSFD